MTLLPRPLRSLVASVLAASAGFACSGGSHGAASSNLNPALVDAGELDAPMGTVDCTTEPGVDTYSAGMQKLGVSGLFSFELVSSDPAPPALNGNTFVVAIKDMNGAPVTGELEAKLDMPKHGHSTTVQPVITFDPAQNSYTLDPMYLFMVGVWRIALTAHAAASSSDAGPDGMADAATATDVGVFNFCVQ